MDRNSPVVAFHRGARPPKQVTVVHGATDATAPLAAADALRRALEANDVAVRQETLPDAGHLDFAFRAMYDDGAPFLGTVAAAVRDVV